MTATLTMRQTPTVLTTTTRQRQDIALHEAAHAVAAFRTGTRFTDVVLDPPQDPDCRGVLLLPEAPTFYALAVVLCAGIVADQRLGYPVTTDAGSDMAELVQLAPDLTAETGRPPRAVMLDAFCDARRILRRQHAAVQRVTAALLLDGRLSYDDARRVAQMPGTAPGTRRSRAEVGR